MKKFLISLLVLLNFTMSSATVFYVSSSGNDSYNGLSSSTPWKTIAKVNATSFSPGDQILFNKGDTWAENLRPKSAGTAGNPITFSSYGSGNMPVISGTTVIAAIWLIGMPYIVIDGIKIIDTKMSSTDHSVKATLEYGILVNNSSNTIIRNCDISLVGCGIDLANNSTNVTITNNYIHNLRMVINDPTSGNDWGAVPIIVETSGNTITQNTFDECWAPSNDYKFDGGVIEFYGTSMSNNRITHNKATNCNGFLEIGSSNGAGVANNNIIAYNIIINCGIIGSYHSPGSGGMATSINNLQYYNNTVVGTVLQYTKPNVMFATTGTPQSGMIVLKNNIFWLSSGVNVASSIFNSGQITHTNNIYRMTSGSVGLTIGATEILSSTATLFASTSGDPSSWNLHHSSGSPAINSGVNVGLNSDFDGNVLNNPPSIGVYESSSPTPAVPVYVSSNVANTNPSLLEVTYNMSLANVIPATSAFSVKVNSVARTVNTVVISGAKVQLTLASPIIYGDVVTVAYTKPSTNPLQTTSGGQAASTGTQSVTNSVTGAIPVYVSSSVANATPSLLEMTYSLSLANIVPTTSSFTVVVNSATRTVNSVAVSGTKVQLTLSSPVSNGNIVTVSYTKPSSNPLQTVSGGQAASVSARQVTNNILAPAPAYVSSAVENAKPSVLEITFNQTLANIVPATGSFNVMVNSAARTVSAVVISGTKIQLTLSSPIVYGNVITVAYNKPSSNPIQNSSGSQANSFSAQSVVNLVAGATPVYVSSVVENAKPSLIEITYNQSLANVVPATSAFSVMVNSAARTVSSVVISGTKVQLTLSAPIVYGNVVTVAYNKPSTSPIQTSSGAQAATMSAQSVSNKVAAPTPVYVSSAIENATPSLLEITYNQTLANIIPAISSFTVMVNSVARTVTSVAISGTKVRLTLSSPVVYGNAVTVSYTIPSTNPLQTSAGAKADAMTAKTVTNRTSGATPVYVSSAVENATPSLVEITYNQPIANIVPSSSSFTVMVNSVRRTVSAISISDTKVKLSLSSPIVYGNIVTVAYNKPSTNPIQTSSGAQAATMSAKTVTNRIAGSTLVYVSSSIDNATPSLLEVTYNQNLANIVPAASAFTILVNSVPRNISSIAISAAKIRLSLSSPIVYGDIVTIAYNKPSTNPIQTSAEVQADSFSAQPVSNKLTGSYPVYVSSVVEDATPTFLEITYSQLLADIVPESGSYTVKINGDITDVSSIEISGDKVFLELSIAVEYGNKITVEYSKPANNWLQSTTGAAAESLPAQSATNNILESVKQNTAPVIVLNYEPIVYSGFSGEIDASGSHDINNDKLTYEWIAPDNVAISSATDSKIQFLAPKVSTRLDINFQLNINDGLVTVSKVIAVGIHPYKPEFKAAIITNAEASAYIAPDLPKNIVDGILSTKWSVDGDNQWIVLTLEEPMAISHLEIAFSEGQNYGSKFDILASTDNLNWESILTDYVSCSFSGGIQVFDFPAPHNMEYSYVKLVGHGNSTDTRNVFSEFRIFGTFSIPSDPIMENRFTVYPNPARDVINVSMEYVLLRPETIKIVDMNGRLVLMQPIKDSLQNIQIYSRLKDGTYLLTMLTGNTIIHSQKLIINNVGK